MKRVRNSLISALCGLACLASGSGLAGTARADITQLQKNFQTPPDHSRMMVRWWWYGPAVTPAGIEREMKAMLSGGIGGFEVQPTYPLVVDGPNVKNLKFMSPEFLSMLGVVSSKAKEMGMRMDLTLGSGWPYGGPMFARTDGAKALTTFSVPAAAGVRTVPSNSPTAFAAFIGPAPTAAPAEAAPAAPAAPAAAGGGRGGRGGRGGGGGGDMSGYKEVPLVNGVAQLPADFKGGNVMFFDYRSGIMAVKRPAFGADGPVIDHLSAKAVDKFIELVAEPELKACGSNPPYSIFCDSLEINGENWTEDFLAEFQKRRGYDLKPHLPALIGNFGERTADIRHDYGQTVTDLFNENFNAKFMALAKKYGSRYRVQGYGSPPAALYSYAFSDLPEGEAGGNGNWRSFRTTRYAASASHLMNQPLVSSETFTWLHQAPFRAIPLDMKGEADTHFLDGVNQIDCHGWGYTPETLAYPGGSFYAAAVFGDANPWYVGMKEVTGYLNRVSQMMREGTPGNDIALYGSNSDVWSNAGTGFSSMNSVFTSQTAVLGAVLSAGYNLDIWDDGMLAMKGKAEGGKLVFGDVKYPIVVLNGPQSMPLATARKLEEFAKGGGILVNVSDAPLPSRVPGLNATAADQTELKAIMARLFTAPGAPGIAAIDEATFLQKVGPKLAPDVRIEPANLAIGAVHRRADGGDVYFVANTSTQKQTIKATFRQEGKNAEMWNPLNGKVKPIAGATKSPGGTTVSLDLEPYGSTLVVFTNRQLPATPVAAAPQAMDLSTDWDVKFASGPGGQGAPVKMSKLVSWTELPGMANYSGVASYEKKITVNAAMAKAEMVLSFGESSQVGAGGGRGGQGFAAVLNTPVHDTAVVFVNDKRVGAAWCPPFNVDVSGMLKEGENTIRVDVGNTAVNYLAKAGFPNYNQRAVDAAFPPGNRFQPQGMNLYAQPLVSGLLGPIKLEAQ